MRVLGVVVLVAVLAGCSTGDGGGDPPESKESEAMASCRDAVLERLKAPATAEFGDASASPVFVDKEYVVMGGVDAQNGFGALIRSDYVCTVAFSPEGEPSVTSVTIN